MPGLTPAQLEEFDRQGYLVVSGLLDVELDIQPILAEYEELLGNLCQRWHAEGKLSSDYRSLPFWERLHKAILESGNEYSQYFDFTLPLSKPITEETPIHTGPAVFSLLTSPRLLDAVGSIIGQEIYSNPVQHIRVKLPERLLPEHMKSALTARTPWHQDLGVVLEEADDSDILTVWMPVTKAGVEHGCLGVVPGSHKGELLEHCPSGGVYIPGVLMPPQERRVPVPMMPGDVLFMHKKTVHGSLENTSEEIRCSLDLRYNPTGHRTGRPQFPGFVARSLANPDSVLKDHVAWTQLWHEARARLAKDPENFRRWKDGSPLCA